MLHGLHHDVVNIDMHVAAELLQQALLHAALEGGACILEAKLHGDVAVRPKGCDEGCIEDVSRVQLDPVVAGVGVQKGQELTVGYGVDHLIHPRQGKRILGACLVQASVVDTHAPGVVLLRDED